MEKVKRNSRTLDPIKLSNFILNYLYMLQRVFFNILSPSNYSTLILLAHVCVYFEVDMVDKVDISNYLYVFK